MSLEPKSYKNVMEIFVDEEIQYQLNNHKTLSSVAGYFNLIEVATFALNRLPTLYASSLEGFQKQRKKLKEDAALRRKIVQAVTQAFAAVERDPLRRSTPIELQHKSNDIIEEAKQTINQLTEWASQEELKWIIVFMESFLLNINNQQITEEKIIKLYYLLYYYWQENQ